MLLQGLSLAIRSRPVTTTRNQCFWVGSANIQQLESRIDSETVENIHSSYRPVQSEESNDGLIAKLYTKSLFYNTIVNWLVRIVF